MSEDKGEHAIAWGALEPGTDVISSDGEKLGKVTEVVGDRTVDIFSGIAFKDGLLDKERFAPADLIDRITTSSVSLTAAGSDAEKLEPYSR